MLKKHLLAGVDKGALTEEQAHEKMEAWLKEKEDKVFAKGQEVSQSASDAKQKALDAEKEKNAKREADAKALEEEAAAAVKAEETAKAEEAAKAEEPAAEESAEEEKEA
jgi:small subunit ribosomal protein S16